MSTNSRTESSEKIPESSPIPEISVFNYGVNVIIIPES